MTASGSVALTPECDAFRREFEGISAAAVNLVTPLSEEQFTWRPAPDAWSIALCIDHLNATAREYLPRLDEGIAQAIRRGLYTPGPYAYNWIGRLMVYVVKPTTRIRATAPTPFVPEEGRRREEIMAAFRAYQIQYVDRLRQASGLDLGRARVASPAVRWIRMPLGSAFAMMIAHEQRHLAQARRVLEAEGFPPRRD
jgi:uncharacterized damage-inducible protein DinB